MKRSLAIVTIVLFLAAGSRAVKINVGGEEIEGTWQDGRIVATNYWSNGRELYWMPLVVVPLKGGSEWAAALQLKFAMGKEPVKPGGIHGLHGFAYDMDGQLSFPEISSTNRVDMSATTDNTRIVVMVWPNGPAYYTTNSGRLWRVYDESGTYDFPLTSGPDGDGGFYAKATIHRAAAAHKTNSPPTNSLPRTYVVAADPDGRRVAFELNSRIAAPALTISPIPEGVIVSWPAGSKGFVLQHKSNLSASDWIDMTNEVVAVGLENRVFVAPPTTNDFFRLRNGSP